MRRCRGGWWVGGLAAFLSLAPAHASLYDSVCQTVERVRDALPVRVGFGPPGSMSAAQRDSVRRVRLARLARLAGETPPAWVEDRVLLPAGVEVSFCVADTVSRDVVIHRRGSDGEWSRVGRVRVDKKGHGAWRDTTARAGRILELALALRTAHGTRFVTLPRFRMPGAGLSLTGSLAPDRSTTLVFRLPTGYPATLEVFDVTGRRLGEVDVSCYRTGEHQVTVPKALLPSRGVYFARLSQNGAWATEKVIVP